MDKSLKVLVSVLLVAVIIGFSSLFVYLRNNKECPDCNCSLSENNNVEDNKNTDNNNNNSNIKEQDFENNGIDFIELGKNMFIDKFFKSKSIEDYKIKKLEVRFYYQDKDVINYHIVFDIKTKDNYWLAGNGEPDGDWIRNKNQYFDLIKINGNYELKNGGTSPSMITDFID